MATFTTKFDFGDKVQIDSDDSISATVTSIRFFLPGQAEYGLSWFHNGQPVFMQGCDEWRLRAAEK